MNRFGLLTATLSALTFGGVWLASGPTRPAAASPPMSTAASIHYSGCNAVRAAGKAPLHATQPGYRPEMDGDGDGIACEPHRGSGGEGPGWSGGSGRRRR